MLRLDANRLTQTLVNGIRSLWENEANSCRKNVLKIVHSWLQPIIFIKCVFSWIFKWIPQFQWFYRRNNEMIKIWAWALKIESASNPPSSFRIPTDFDMFFLSKSHYKWRNDSFLHQYCLTKKMFNRNPSRNKNESQNYSQNFFEGSIISLSHQSKQY